MKSRVSIFLFTLISFSLLISSNSTFSGTKLTLEQANDLWKELFSAPRGTACKSAEVKKSVLAQLNSQKNLRKSGGNTQLIVNNKFAWIKRWGYGSVSYLFDYLDPIFQDDLVSAFNKLYQDTRKESSADTDKLKDPFKQKIKGDTTIFDLSVNLIQIDSAMKKFKWYIDPSQKDFAMNFLINYDINNDGRLNARELVLGGIMHNKNQMGAEDCENCFQDLIKKIDAIFIFIDCNNDGSISAQELWNGLKQLVRSTPKWNIFSIDNKESIRTSAINDFVIKNGSDGKIDKHGFRMGVLLGYWDRQTTEHGVVSDNTRNLKNLRWKDFGMIDTASFSFIKEKQLAEMISKATK